MTNITNQLNIIRKHQSKPPILTRSITDELGLTLFGVTNWPDNISGKIIKDQNSASGYAIYVNEKHAEVRKRFTIAHEIAHYILHKDLIGNGITDDGLYRSGLSNSVEAAANKLAADILMPWHLINQAVAEGLDTVALLANHFRVSQTAMAIRLGIPNES
jgi:Zn-dependent peptidase ImmA (M78 family)